MRSLVASGCRSIALAAREPSSLAGNVRELEALGAAKVKTVAFDASDTTSHDAAVDECFADGDVDLVLIAFGVLGHGAGVDTPPDVAAAAVTTNYVGVVSSGLAVARRLREQGHGTI